MNKFPHLKFVKKVAGKPRFGGGNKGHKQTIENRKNRKRHSEKLALKTNNIKTEHEKLLRQRNEKNLALLEADIVPILLKVNPKLLKDSDFNLHTYNVEILSQKDDNLIIGASLDNFKTLKEKINGFENEESGTGKIADLWEITDGNREHWRVEFILSDTLSKKWAKIQDNDIFELEVSIAFDKPFNNRRFKKKPDSTKKGAERRIEEYRKYLEERDEKFMERENDFSEFIKHYGKISSSIIDIEDSFGCEVEINGKGLKDLVINYPFVFEVSEKKDILILESSSSNKFNKEINIFPPNQLDTEVGVIDSGIMEGHKYIAPAIKSMNSKSYLRIDSSTSDYVRGGGHGTRVAGAILYPSGISNLSESYKLPCFVRNLRVLDKSNRLDHDSPAALMRKIVAENEECSIFNLSVNVSIPNSSSHMPMWSAVIDNLMHEKNVLFVLSSGNIDSDAIAHYLSNDIDYPEYLNNTENKITEPSHSSFALTVGSINHLDYETDDWKSIGEKDAVSAFSRTGMGMWGMVKPDVVEYGGGYVVSKDGNFSIKTIEETSPELLRSNLYAASSAYERSSVGTSFAAPKVTSIAAQLKNIYTDENMNLIRALIIQGSRLPNDYFMNPTLESICHFGYGHPSIDRVTKNNNQRITFYNTGEIAAEEGHVYSVRLPEEIISQANDFDVLIEVTLAFTAKVRRTRRRTKSYLSTWLEWRSSNLDEESDDFKKRVLSETEKKEVKHRNKSSNTIKWKIRENKDWGEVRGVNRNNSTAQKDWAVLKAFELPDEINFAISGHKGWDKNKEKIPYAIVVSIEAFDSNVPVYNSIKIQNQIEIETWL